MARFDRITPRNVKEFRQAVRAFAERRGYQAGSNWLMKMNPEVDRHEQMEFASCGDGYTRGMARRLVRNEFDQQPLPFACKCGRGVCWYRATASVMKCDVCGEIDMEHDRWYLADYLRV
jgi:hypothetical protein